MALYSGFSSQVADLISLFGISKSDIIKIINRYPQHKIGELKFITGFGFKQDKIPGLKMQNGIWKKDPDAKDDFLGWVYPNGQLFSCEDFPEAAAVYAQSTSATSFRIPDLTGKFFAGYSTGYDKTDIKTLNVNMKNNIPAKHTHTLTTDETGNITLSISNGFVLYASPSAGTYWKSVKCKTGQGRSYEVPMLHAGNVPKNFREDVVPFPMNIRVKIGDLAPMFQGGDTEGAVSRDGSRLDPAPSFIPANRLQPVMIYIGSAKASDSREEFIVIFRDWDGTVLSEQTVIKGQPAEAPDTPSRLNYEFKEWDKPFSSIIANTEIYAVYQPKTYTVKAYSNNDEYGTVAPSSRSVVYGDMVELTASPARDKMLSCWIKHGSTYEEGTSDLRYKVYPNDNNIGADNQLSVTAVFIDQPDHIGWSLKWDPEYNCDDKDRRVHFASNIANYIYKNQLISAESAGPIDKYAYTVASDTAIYRGIPANNREYLTLEKLYGRKIGDKYEVSVRENYGIFLLCTKGKDSTGLSAAVDDFYGYVFDTGSTLNVSKFVTPTGNIMINGWEDFPGADGVVLSSVNFTKVRDPEMYPVPESVIDGNSIYLNVRTRGDDIVESRGEKVFPSDVSCATKAQYTAFWGSENPVFITDDQIIEN